jgi:hypothetical protein
VSPLITAEMVKNWEANHRPLEPGDVVLFVVGTTTSTSRNFPRTASIGGTRLRDRARIPGTDVAARLHRQHWRAHHRIDSPAWSFPRCSADPRAVWGSDHIREQHSSTWQSP